MARQIAARGWLLSCAAYPLFLWLCGGGPPLID
jgi:hypothetical protein